MPREEIPLSFIDAASAEQGEAWFVYLLALTDCSAFKVGFSCNPLQRISTFSRRYFEQFDLLQSALLRLDSCDDARLVEAALKAELAAQRACAPSWVPGEAGGQTEWFLAPCFGQAEARLRAFLGAEDPLRLTSAFDFLRNELARRSSSFEYWACHQAQLVQEARSAAERGYRTGDAGRTLRDWVDAYRYFDLPLYADDAEVRAYVAKSARLAAIPTRF